MQIKGGKKQDNSLTSSKTSMKLKCSTIFIGGTSSNKGFSSATTSKWVLWAEIFTVKLL